MKKFITFGVCLFISVQAFAYGTVTGKIVQVRIDQNGLGMVMFDAPVVGGYASCRINEYTNWLSFNANTAAGRSVMAMAMAAKIAGITVAAIGLGTCNNYGSYIEDWDYGVML